MSHQPTKLEVRASSMTTVECEGFALKRLFFALAPKHKDDGGLETWNLSHPVISLETHCTCLDFYTFSRLITMVQSDLWAADTHDTRQNTPLRTVCPRELKNYVYMWSRCSWFLQGQVSICSPECLPTAGVR